MQKITLAREAMATRFEFVLLGEDPVQLRAAGEEALDEIGRIESQLSLYRRGSEVAAINASAAHFPVRVSPSTLALIEQARALWEVSSGAFDITVAPLVRCWGFMKGTGACPSIEQISQAREVVGMQYLEMDFVASTVRFKRAGMMIDLGSIGKGYALDIAAEILRDAGVSQALLHGGTSTIYGLGCDVAGPWKIALDQPVLPSASPGEEQSPLPRSPLSIVELENQAMSVSAVWGKFFISDGKLYGHVIDPRTGWPVQNALLGCVVMTSAMESDALSTAVLLGNDSEIAQIEIARPRISYLRAKVAEGVGIKFSSRGIPFDAVS